MFYTLWSLKCAMNTWFLPPLFFSITNNTSIKHLCTVLVYLWKYTRVKGTCISSKKSLSQFIIHSQKHYRYLCPYNLANTGYYPFPTDHWQFIFLTWTTYWYFLPFFTWSDSALSYWFGWPFKALLYNCHFCFKMLITFLNFHLLLNRSSSNTSLENKSIFFMAFR